MAVVTLIIALALAIIVRIFAVENVERVEIRFFNNLIIEGQVGMVLVFAYVIGLASGLMLMLPGWLKARTMLLIQKKKIEGLAKSAE